MLIENSSLLRTTLFGKTILLTGAGGGIGYEAARALSWLGAKVIIAEIDKGKGEIAERKINQEMGSIQVEFHEIDLSDEEQIERLVQYTKDKYGFIDVVFNNATMTAMGAVEQVSIATWDKSYAVNFRVPLLLTQKFLPEMKKYNKGTIVFVPSSGAAPYMGAYEVFKTAQVELCNTLAGELENTNINVFSIGPGLVKTDTAIEGIKTISSLMGITTTEFYTMNEAHMLDVEEAGTGFALSVVFAEKYNGQEIGSIQALMDAGIIKNHVTDKKKEFSEKDKDELVLLVSKAAITYIEQYNGWLSRNVFERQWVLRDFKKIVGFSAEQFKGKIQRVQSIVNEQSLEKLSAYKEDFEKLEAYYQHQHKLLHGFEKNSQKLKINSDILKGWIEDIQSICNLI